MGFLLESMTVTLLAPPAEIIHLSGISWKTDETLLAQMSDRRLYLEIMAPSTGHERFKKVAGRFVETMAEELRIRIEPLGSTTFKRPQLIGAEPKEYNKTLAKERIIIEPINTKLKILKILSCKYRNCRRRYSLIVNLLSAIYTCELGIGIATS